MSILTICLFLVLLAIVLTSPALRSAAPAECPADIPPARVVIEAVEGEIRHDYGRDGKYLAELHDGHAFGTYPLGLTEIHGQFSYRASFDAYAAEDGLCLAVREIRYVIGHKAVEVYVDRKYPQDSCQFKAVMAHENEHLNNFRKAVTAAMANIENRLRAEMDAGNHVVFGRNPKEAETRRKSWLKRVFREEIERFQNDISSRDRILDSDKSRRRMMALCPSW